MQKSLSDLSVAQLQRAIVIKGKIETLEAELAAVLTGAGPGLVKGRRSGRSRGRPKSVAAAKPKAKRKLSAAARKRLSEMAKARWKKAKAAGKSRL